MVDLLKRWKLSDGGPVAGQFVGTDRLWNVEFAEESNQKRSRSFGISVPDNSGSSCARSRKRASQEAETRLSERFFPPDRLGKIFPAITHHADSPTTMRFDRDGLEGMPPDPDPQTAHPGQGHQPKQPFQAVSKGHR